MDWLLTAHLVAPLQYEMGSFWSPISIRDQMVRGQELVLRAVSAGLIGTTRRLIIVGAGAGGIAAALTAQREGVPVMVIERHHRAFDRQLRTQRTIYPYLYDWPHNRHDQAYFGPPAVLPWREMLADQAAAGWTRSLTAAMVAFESSVTRPPTGEPAIVVDGDTVNVHVTTPAGSGWFDGGMVLSGVGFGEEKTSIDNYNGWRYWEADTIGEFNLGLPKKPDVLIAGGGDGALQDTIRVLLEPRFENFRDLLGALPTIPADVRLAIADADDTATRAWLWSNRSDDCSILGEVHRRVDQIVDHWWMVNRSSISAALDKMWRNDVSSLRLVHACNHFGRSFALNRFLVLLLERAAKERQQCELALRMPYAAPRFERMQNVRLAAVNGQHRCTSSRPCLQGAHAARLREEKCSALGAEQPHAFTADLIILRGGVAPPNSPLAQTPTSNSRQYLPARPRA